MDRISVAMCTYNGNKYIEQQIDSILRQSVIPDEIVICDDGSTDATVEICKRIAEESKSCKLRISVNEQNLGYIKNFEKAISLCEGDIIFLCDQDDVWRRDKVETVKSAFLNDREIGVVISDSLLVDGNLNSLGETVFQHMGIDTNIVWNNRKLFERVSKQNFASGSAMAIGKKMKKYVLPFPDVYVHDQWIMIVAALNTKVRCIDEPLVYYRQHGSNSLGIKQNGHAAKISKIKRALDSNDVEKKLKQLEFLVPYIKNNYPIEKLDIEYTELLQRHQYYKLRHDVKEGKFTNRVKCLSELRHSGLYGQYGNGLMTYIKDMLLLLGFGR